MQTQRRKGLPSSIWAQLQRPDLVRRFIKPRVSLSFLIDQASNLAQLHKTTILILFKLVRCEVGTASMYNPPYTPSACYGNDASQFPSSNLFAAAGEGIWDNGAACGRQYLVRCISAAIPRTCIPGQTIQVRIIDRAETSVSRSTRAGTTMVLSDTAFGTIANQIASINIEFQQV